MGAPPPLHARVDGQPSPRGRHRPWAAVGSRGSHSPFLSSSVTVKVSGAVAGPALTESQVAIGDCRPLDASRWFPGRRSEHGHAFVWLFFFSAFADDSSGGNDSPPPRTPPTTGFDLAERPTQKRQKRLRDPRASGTSERKTRSRHFAEECVEGASHPAAESAPHLKPSFVVACTKASVAEYRNTVYRKRSR